VSRPTHNSWQDFVIAGLLALLTGREVLRELHAPRTGPSRANGHAMPAGPAARVALQEAGLPAGVHLPHPSIWPMVLGAGLSLILFGVVTSYAFIAIGVVLILGAVGGWIGDLLHADPD
jgi:hypothetical protein